VRGYRAAALVSILVLGSGGLGAELHSPARADTRARVPGSTLIYGSTGEPDTLNPETSGLQVTGDVDSAVFDSLVGYDTSNRPFPRLASGYSVSADGLSWAFTLRHGVKWADNQPFTSADVAFTYASFIGALAMVGAGILFMPIDIWLKGYLAMGIVMLVQSCVTLTKTARDRFEGGRMVNRIEDARAERLLMEVGKE